jgi:3-oxoacyl-[acyl-carrier-protein] synthase II
MRRVVITGLGALTPIGVGQEAFHQAQLAGKSGVRPITRFDASALPVRIAAEVDVNPEDYLDKKELRRLDRFVQYALIAAELALKDSGLDPSALDPERVGTLVGTGIGGMETWEAQSKVFLERGPNRISPFFIPMMIANMASAHIAMRYGFQGPSSTAVTACATGSDALGSAMRMIQLGEAEVVLAGGTEAAITPMAIGAFAVMRALSTRNEEPEKASRPFTLSRDGFVMGEGAGGAGPGGVRARQEAGGQDLRRACGLWPERRRPPHHRAPPRGAGGRLGHGAGPQGRPGGPGRGGLHQRPRHLHPRGGPGRGPGHQAGLRGARQEAHGLQHQEHDRPPPGGRGGVEAIATVQALYHGVIPPTINLEDPDPELDLDFVPEPREARVDYALSNSFAFGGQNAVLLFKRV